MSIVFHKESKQFHIYNKSLSYIIKVMDNNQLGNLYYGKKIADRESFDYLFETQSRPLGALSIPKPVGLCLQYIKQEYPSYGTGDYRYGACTALQENGSRITCFEYVSYEIYSGKRKIEPLPAVYVEDEKEATSIDITMYDKEMDTELILTYTINEDLPVITRSAKFIHNGDSTIYLQNAMSICVDLPDSEYDLFHLSGAWARERYVKRRKLEEGIQSVYSMRGCSSAEHNPFLALLRPSVTEDSGEVYGFSLVYSGSFLGQVEVCSHGTTRVLMGIHPDTFEWPLQKGESFQTPEAVMVYSTEGLNGMSKVYHELYRTRLARGYWRDRARPVLLNNGEATYMDFDEEKILQIARKAKETGVELFVLDDGWFGERDDDDRSLGDWFADNKKLTDGIEGLSRKVEDLGLKFGLWIEPEMVNKNSNLYREHPDYLISVPGRFETPSRQQHVLDFSRQEVVDAIFGMLKKILIGSKISYIKWDMNRYITECYSKTLSPQKQGMVMHKYILGVYRLYTMLLEEFPDLLFESCSSGGARFDPGMLYFAPQAWCSDNTDALSRMKIQYGTSYVYPVSSMGAHVSAVPNHQTNRTTPLVTRGNIAYFGAFGYELDLNKLSDEEIETVKEQIIYYKENRELLHKGDFYRIDSPFLKNIASWIVVSKDKESAVAVYNQILNEANHGWVRFRLKGLDEDMLYEVSVHNITQKFYGSELMYAGIPLGEDILPEEVGDFASILFHIIKTV